MPPRIKLILSIIVALAAVAGYFFQSALGQTGPSYAALAFGLIAIVSMWIFPEVSHKKGGDASPSGSAPTVSIKAGKAIRSVVMF